MALQTITAGGIRAFCSEILVNRMAEIYLLAVAGYQATVKGIIASVLEKKSVMTKIDGDYYRFNRAEESYNIHYQRLPSGLAEGIIIPEIALPGTDNRENFVVLTDQHEKEMFFKHLDEKSEIPLHDSWTNWLWQTFLDREWLTQLENPIGTYKGYIVQLNDEELKDAIAEAIAYQTPEIIACFQKGNDYDARDFT